MRAPREIAILGLLVAMAVPPVSQAASSADPGSLPPALQVYTEQVPSASGNAVGPRVATHPDQTGRSGVSSNLSGAVASAFVSAGGNPSGALILALIIATPLLLGAYALRRQVRSGPRRSR